MCNEFFVAIIALHMRNSSKYIHTESQCVLECVGTTSALQIIFENCSKVISLACAFHLLRCYAILFSFRSLNVLPKRIFPYKLIIHHQSNREQNKMAFRSSRRAEEKSINFSLSFTEFFLSFFVSFGCLLSIRFTTICMQGQFFSGSAYRIYLLGNPIIWWSNLIFLTIFVLEFLVSAVKQQRGYKNNLENNGNVTITTTPRQANKSANVLKIKIERMLENTMNVQCKQRQTRTEEKRAEQNKSNIRMKT